MPGLNKQYKGSHYLHLIRGQPQILANMSVIAKSVEEQLLPKSKLLGRQGPFLCHQFGVQALKPLGCRLKSLLILSLLLAVSHPNLAVVRPALLLVGCIAAARYSSVP